MGKIELSGRDLVIAACVSIALAALIVYIVFYVPLLKEIGAKHFECGIYEDRVADARKTIDFVGKAYGERVLITEGRISFAMDELAKHGKSMGINFISITPKNIVDEKGAGYKTLPVEMEIEAPDEKLSEFIGSLEDQKKTVIKVESFDVVPEEKDRARVNAKLTIDLYISKREYAE